MLYFGIPSLGVSKSLKMERQAIDEQRAGLLPFTLSPPARRLFLVPRPAPSGQETEADTAA